MFRTRAESRGVVEMIDAIALGELLIDFSCNEIDSDGYPSLVSHPGGAPANWLGTIQKLGGKTELIAKVGDDVFGSLLVKTLKKAGIGTRGVSKASDVFTTLAFVTFNEKRDREFSFSRKPGADTKLGLEDIPFNLIDDSKVFHFGSLSLTDEPSKSSTRAAVDYARKHAKLISFDPNYRKPLWSSEQDAKLQMLWGLSVSDVVKISDEEVSFLFPGLSFDDAGQYIIRNYGVKLVYVTLGSSGSIISNASASVRVDSFRNVDVVDTTGAGDIYGGSAMWALLQTGKAPEHLSAAELSDIAKFASISSGLSVTRPGGLSSIPSLEEVKRFL